MDKQKQLAVNSVVLFLGKAPQLLSILLLPLYTKYLSPHDYGTVDLLITYAFLFILVLTLQTEMAGFRFLVDARSSQAAKRKVISSTVQIATTVLIGFLFFSLLLSQFIHIKYSYLIIGYVCSTIVSNLFLQFARGLGRNVQFAIASTITGLMTIVSNILLIVVLHYGAAGLLWSLMLANLAGAIYLFFALKLLGYISYRHHDKKMKREMIKYSSPLVPSGILAWIILASDRTIIATVIGLSASGIYAVANKFSILLTGIVYVYNLAWSESASMHIGAKDAGRFFSRTFDETIKFFGSAGLLMIAFLPLLFKLLVGAKYSQSYSYIPILVIAVVFSAIVGFYSGIYVAKKKTRQIATTAALAAGINVVVTISLINFIGIYAAAIASVVSLLAMAIYRYFDIRKYVSLSYSKKLLLEMVAIYSVTTFLCYFNHPLGNIINMVLATLAISWLNKSTLSFVRSVLSNRKVAARVEAGVAT